MQSNDWVLFEQVVLSLKLYRQLILASVSFILDLYICWDFYPNHFLNSHIITTEGNNHHSGYSIILII